MLYWICKETECDPNKTQIKHVVLRNFSGYYGFDPWKVFEGSPLNNFPPVPDKHEKIEEWREKLCDAFKDDETAHQSLKDKFIQLNGVKTPEQSQEMLLQAFDDQLKKGDFCDREIQHCFETELGRYVQHKFEVKV